MSYHWIAIILLFILVFLFRIRPAYLDSLEYHIGQLTRELEEAKERIEDLESKLDELESCDFVNEEV